MGLCRKTVGVTGFEPATSWSQTTRSSQAELHPGTPSVRWDANSDNSFSFPQQFENALEVVIRIELQHDAPAVFADQADRHARGQLLSQLIFDGLDVIGFDHRGLF